MPGTSRSEALLDLRGKLRQERQWDEHLRLWADGGRQFGWGTLRLSGLVQEGRLRYRNGQLGLDETGRTLITSIDAGQSHDELSPGEQPTE